MTARPLVREPIDANALVREVAAPAHGAILLFLGVVREVNDGRGVTGIEYSAYESDGAARDSRRSRAKRASGSASSVAIVHRLGSWRSRRRASASLSRTRIVTLRTRCRAGPSRSSSAACPSGSASTTWMARASG